jgi:hypothetical protein
MLSRRLLVLFAVLLGLTALVTSVAPRPSGLRPGLAQPTPEAMATPAPTQTSSRRIVKTISADEGRSRTRIRARVGDVLALTVRGDMLDSVEIDQIGEVKPIEPGSPAHFEALLDHRGELRISLVDAARLVGVVDVARAR